jgi:hypothetical protein
MIFVTDAKALTDYRLWLRFSDGRTGEVDLRAFVFNDARPIVAELQDPDLFGSIELDMNTVVWANGLDFAPEFLYDRMVANGSPGAQLR